MRQIFINTRYSIRDDQNSDISYTADTGPIEYLVQNDLNRALDVHNEKVGAIERKLQKAHE